MTTVFESSPLVVVIFEVVDVDEAEMMTQKN